MRISSTLFFQTGLNSINAQQSDLMHLYQQIGSGQRMVTPADDPLAAAQAINISQSLSLNQRFADNREVAKRNLGIEENALNSMTTLLQDVKTALIQAGNGTLSDADRATLSNVLANARSSLLGLANSTDGSGQYLFSGSQGGTAAFQEDSSGKVKYAGDQQQRKIQADQTRQIAGSDVGSDIFSRAAPGTNSYLSSAKGGNAGTGLISTPTITGANDPNVGNRFEITFTATSSYKVEVIDSAGGKTTIVPSGTYIPGETTSLNLSGGVQVKFSGKPGVGDKFTVAPASSADLRVSAGVNIGTGVISTPTITDPNGSNIGKSFEIKFTALAAPVYDYRVYVNGTIHGGDEAVPYGQYTVGQADLLRFPGGVGVMFSGTPLDGGTFTVAPSVDLNMFDTLDQIITSLATGLQSDVATASFQNTLASAMQRIDVNYNNVLTVRASVGARLNEIDALDNNGALRSLSYKTQLSGLEDVDYYSASMQLELRKSALEAAALAFRKIQGTSLFNMGAG